MVDRDILRFDTEQAAGSAPTEWSTLTDIRHGGDAAYYTPSQDFIQLPAFEAFRDAQGYYATLAHESTHWTRHKSRLDRDIGRKRMGDEGYAREELVCLDDEKIGQMSFRTGSNQQNWTVERLRSTNYSNGVAV